MKNRWLFIVMGILVLFACTHQISNPNGGSNGGGNGGGNGNGGGGGGGDSLVCFEEEILPLFQTNCAKSGCHDAKSHQEGYILDSYDNIVSRGIDPGNASGSKLYQVLSAQRGAEEDDEVMPPPPNQPLAQAQIDLIGQWIDEGAQNTTNCSNVCDVSLYTYSGAVRPILDVHCVGCHNNTTQNGGVNLATYTGVQTVALNGKLAGVITGAAGFPQMPPNGQTLSDCNITQITEWINSGAPNN